MRRAGLKLRNSIRRHKALFYSYFLETVNSPRMAYYSVLGHVDIIPLKKTDKRNWNQNLLTLVSKIRALANLFIIYNFFISDQRDWNQNLLPRKPFSEPRVGKSLFNLFIFYLKTLKELEPKFAHATFQKSCEGRGCI